MNIALDTNVLIWAFREGGDAESKDLERRARILFRMMDDLHAVAIVPTIVVAEYLAGIELVDHGRVITEFQARFVMPTLDLPATAIAAELWLKHRSFPAQEQSSRQVLKADVLIVATAKAAGASRFYSHDARCRKLATAIDLEARDLPEFHEDMFVDKQIRDGVDPGPSGKAAHSSQARAPGRRRR